MTRASTAALVKRAAAAQQAGDFVQAGELCREILADDPGNSFAHYHLGMTALQRRNYSEAERSLARAVSGSPQEAALHVALSEVQCRMGQFEAARRSAQRAVALQPLMPMAHANLGLAMSGLRKNIEAERSFARALQYAPTNAVALAGLAALRLRQRRFAEGQRLAADAIRAQPEYVEHYILLGDCYFADGKMMPAVEAYRRARTVDPSSTEAESKYNVALMRLGGVAGARAALEAAAERSPNAAIGHVLLGSFLAAHGFLDDAASVLRRALVLEPANASARSALTSAIHIDSRDSPDFVALERAYREAGSDGAERDLLGLALAKALDDLGDYAQAFDHIVEANALRRKRLDFSLEREAASFAAIRTTFTAEFINDHRRSATVSPTPIFIVGMPRSGTTLTEQILSGSANVYAAGELEFLRLIATQTVNANPIAEAQRFGQIARSDDYRRIAEIYIDWLPADARPKRFVTDKLPHNFQLIGLIRIAFPNAKVVHVRRDPLDNCLSMFSTAFASAGMNFTNDLTELGRYYNLYRELMQHWTSVLPGEIHEVRYESMVSEPEATSRSLFDFCGLEWSPGVLDFHRRKSEVKTASFAQVRRPIYKDSVDRAARYGERLDPLRKALAEWTED